ncbi:hypothetical protein B0H11DRAFT_1985640 [Mycena galericulata]|nr:hypothetical protein B0H11DRAFT_1985640 [Mycena galericulata]
MGVQWNVECPWPFFLAAYLGCWVGGDHGAAPGFEQSRTHALDSIAVVQWSSASSPTSVQLAISIPAFRTVDVRAKGPFAYSSPLWNGGPSVHGACRQGGSRLTSNPHPTDDLRIRFSTSASLSFRPDFMEAGPLISCLCVEMRGRSFAGVSFLASSILAIFGPLSPSL